MLKSRLCDYSDLYILVKQNITVVGAGTTNFQIFLTYYFYPWIEIIRKEYLKIGCSRSNNSYVLFNKYV